jgi:hypothetical protein
MPKENENTGTLETLKTTAIEARNSVTKLANQAEIRLMFPLNQGFARDVFPLVSWFDEHLDNYKLDASGRVVPTKLVNRQISADQQYLRKAKEKELDVKPSFEMLSQVFDFEHIAGEFFLAFNKFDSPNPLKKFVEIALHYNKFPHSAQVIKQVAQINMLEKMQLGKVSKPTTGRDGGRLPMRYHSGLKFDSSTGGFDRNYQPVDEPIAKLCEMDGSRREVLLDAENITRVNALISHFDTNIEQELQISADKVLPLLELASNDQLYKLLLTTDLSLSHKDSNIGSFILDHLDLIKNVRVENLEQYIEVIDRIEQSSSGEVQRIKKELLLELASAEDPLGALEQIEYIFEQDTLPATISTFRVFTALNSASKIEKTIRRLPFISPVTQRVLDNGGSVHELFFADLLKVHMESGNPSLQKALARYLQAEEVISLLDRGVQIEPSEQKLLLSVLTDSEIIFDMKQKQFQKNPTNTLDELRERFGNKLGTSSLMDLIQPLRETFLKPVGLSSFKEAMEHILNIAAQLDQRSIDLGEKFELKKGDIVKGVQSAYLEDILQNGNLAKEFLGKGASTDITPFGTDALRVNEVNEKDGLSKMIGTSEAQDFGDIFLIIQDRGQLYSSNGEKNTPAHDQYEVYTSGIVAENHVDIRTGISTAEVSFIVVKDSLIKNTDSLDQVFLKLAKLKHHIPVIDSGGKVIFSRDQYLQLREVYRGISHISSEHIDFSPTTISDKHYQQIQELKETIELDRSTLQEVSGQVTDTISEVLGTFNLGKEAVLADTGSTGRGTNMPKDYDFDLSLLIPISSFSSVHRIYESLKEKFNADEVEFYFEGRSYAQIRLYGAKIDGRSLDIDIGVNSKANKAVFASYQAVSMKLQDIRNEQGEDAYNETIANIVLTKQVLKESQAYKTLSKSGGDGGIGGIGVENWILANGGNMIAAFRSFWSAAHVNGQRLSLDEFRSHYKVFNAGVNLKLLRSDNYMNNLTQEGYENMLKAIEPFVAVQTLRR